MILWLWGPQMDLNWPFPEKNFCFFFFFFLIDKKKWLSDLLHNAILHIWHNDFLVWFSHLLSILFVMSGGAVHHSRAGFGSVCVRAIITICHQEAKNNMALFFCCGRAFCPDFSLPFINPPIELLHTVSYCIKAWKTKYHIVQGNLLFNNNFSFSPFYSIST